jgi:SAM-dependent methyltransferase
LRAKGREAFVVGTVTMAACLVFLVQPMLGRFALPWFGGTPAVWTASMLFFQAALLAGYAWAHGLAVRGRRAALAHGALLLVSLLALPVTPDPSWAPSGSDAQGRLLGMLAASVGLPFVALAATAPLLQAWWARLEGRAPYRLYAWSNAGSLLALAAYPLAIEPAMGVVAQTRLWSACYAAYVLVALTVTWRAWRTLPPPVAVEQAPPPPLRDHLAWAGWAACGSVALLATTEAVSQDLSVTPALWVLPLAIYLVSFVVCFARDRQWPRAVTGPALAVASAGLVALLFQGWRAHWTVQLAGYGAALFVLCMVSHGEMVRRRPPARWLTRFYLSTAVGGAVGGLLVGVVAPRVLPMHLELHAVVLAIWVGFGLAWRRSRTGDDLLPEVLVGFLVVALGVGLGMHAHRRLGGAIEVSRSFFGVLQVKTYGRTPERRIVHLLDGRISHGFQRVAAPREPTAYFVRESGVGRALAGVLTGGPRHVGILGLGVGTLAAYGRPGDRLRFYEINPDVVRVARTHFSFLRDTSAEVEVVTGDGRLSLEREAPQQFDLLALDAFSGDAIPTHLLTAEAFDLYLRHLRPGGVLAVNVSNNHVDASRVVRALAARTGLVATRVRHRATSVLGPYLSDWMLLSRDAATLPPGTDAPGAPPLLWTDDHAPLLPLLRF